MATAVVTGARGVGYEVGRGLARDGCAWSSPSAPRRPGSGRRPPSGRSTGDADVSWEVLDLADLRGGASASAYLPMTGRSTSWSATRHRHAARAGDDVDGFDSTSAPTTSATSRWLAGAARFGLRRPRVVVVEPGPPPCRLDFDDLHGPALAADPGLRESKLANLLFMTNSSAAAMRAGGLTWWAHRDRPTKAILRPDDGLAKRSTRVVSGLRPPPNAAVPIVHAATAADVGTGVLLGPSGPGEIGGRPGPARLASRAGTRSWQLQAVGRLRGVDRRHLRLDGAPVESGR